MASGMGSGPGPGQGSWPAQPQQPPQPGGGRQYPAPGYPSNPNNPLGQSGAAHYSAGGRFPVAEPFDGVNPDGTPRIVRPQLDPREIPALTMYLTQAPIVLAAPGNAQDELVPSAGQVIPRAFHSDGVWVWPAAVGYYLGCYQLPPSDALLAHIRMRNYQLGFVSQETRSAAASELMSVLNAPATPAPPPAPNQLGSQPQYPQAPPVQSPPPGPQPTGSGPGTLSASPAPLSSSAPIGTPNPQPFGQQSAAPQLPSLPAPAPAPATILAPLAESGDGPVSAEPAEAEPTVGMSAAELEAELAASRAFAAGAGKSEPAEESGAAEAGSSAGASASAAAQADSLGQSLSESAGSSSAGSSFAESSSGSLPERASESASSAAGAAESAGSGTGSFDPSASQTALYVFSPNRSTSSEAKSAEAESSAAAAEAKAESGPSEVESKAETEAEVSAVIEAEPAAPAESGSVNAAGPTMVFSAAEAMAQWASLDASLPQAGPPLAPTLFSPELSALGNKHAAWVSEQLEAFTAFMPTGDWSVDHDTRRYTQSERSLLVDGLGTLSPDGIWTWAWSEFGGWDQDSGILDQSRVLRSLAEREDIAELIAPSVDLTGLGDAEDPATAAEMLAWAATGLLNARGYIGHSSSTGGRIYYLVTDPAVPPARPTLALIARALFEGTAAFGESATECVIGYAEHHGWEWNRTPNGVGVAATGLGSFAVEIADDRLVGLTLHV
ncbi:MAG TPA: hypothetical protein VGX23_08015 [Actinocrinis sp.]|nr:hypothetical protein [Actinocrinis sp.]